MRFSFTSSCPIVPFKSSFCFISDLFRFLVFSNFDESVSFSFLVFFNSFSDFSKMLRCSSTHFFNAWKLFSNAGLGKRRPIDECNEVGAAFCIAIIPAKGLIRLDEACDEAVGIFDVGLCLCITPRRPKSLAKKEETHNQFNEKINTSLRLKSK